MQRRLVLRLTTIGAFASSVLLAPAAMAFHDPCTIHTYDYSPQTMTMKVGLDPSECPPLGSWIHIEGVMTREADGEPVSEIAGDIRCVESDPCVMALTLGHPNPESAGYGISWQWHSANGSKGYGGWSMWGDSVGPATSSIEGIAVWNEEEPLWLVRWQEIWEPLGLYD